MSTQLFDHDLLSALHDVARLMRTRFDRYARTYGMTRAQGLILLHLRDQPGLSQNELAIICDVEPITVARLIDRLEANGYVKRCADPNDRRIHRLHLLPAAEPVLTEIVRYRERVLNELAEGVDPAAWAGALKVVHQMKDKLTAENAAHNNAPTVTGE
jgi:DNA-binding MarR family transcriptional regulator